jgi:hypothetical protein
MNKIIVQMSILLGLIVAPTLAKAANVLVVHGINGKDLGLVRELPVDIAVNGTCALKAVTFGSSALVELGAGSYQVTVHPSDGACKATPVINQTVGVPATATNIGLVANLSETSVPQLTAFVNDGANGTIFVNNTSRRDRVFAGIGVRDLVFFSAKALANGDKITAGLFGKNRRLTVTVARLKERKPLFSRSLRRSKAAVLYVVGSRQNGALVILQRID